MALQQLQFALHRVDQLVGVVHQIESVVIEHAGQKGKRLPLVVVDPRRRHRLHADRWMATQTQPRVGANAGHPLGQLPRRRDPHRWHQFTGPSPFAQHRQVRCRQQGGDGVIRRHQRHQHPVGPGASPETAADRIKVLRQNQARQQQIGQPGEALGPEQGHVFVGHPALAAGVAPLGGYSRCRHQVQLGQQVHTVHRHAQFAEPLPPLARFFPTLLAAGGDQLICQK